MLEREKETSLLQPPKWEMMGAWARVEAVVLGVRSKSSTSRMCDTCAVGAHSRQDHAMGLTSPSLALGALQGSLSLCLKVSAWNLDMRNTPLCPLGQE